MTDNNQSDWIQCTECPATARVGFSLCSVCLLDALFRRDDKQGQSIQDSMRDDWGVQE